jgi:hypothetical protein
LLKKITLVLFFLPPFYLSAFYHKDSLAYYYAHTIIKEDIEKILKTLVSEEFEGREAGKEGQKKAAYYISDFFSKNNLSYSGNESYLQKFDAIKQNPFNISVKVSDKAYSLFKDYYYFPEFKDTNLIFDSIVFLGFGIGDSLYSDYANINVDLNNKAAIIFSGEPKNKKGQSYISGTEYMSDWTYNEKKKFQLAKSKGISTLFVIDEEFDFKKDMVKHITKSKMILDVQDSNQLELPIFYVSQQLANEMLENGPTKTKKLRKKIGLDANPISITIKSDIQLNMDIRGEKIETENVLGFIEGSDLKDELIVISAHYDHLGKKDTIIYYGADDNASGTSSILELAQAFSLAKKEGHGPRRSILFIAFSGEEKGLLGSKYYTQFPLLSLNSTIANLNIDMIGRMDTAHQNNPDYIYIIGSDKLSHELHEINENQNKTYTNLELDYKFNDVNDHNRFYYRSDHYNFAKNNIPVIFYFNGVHEDYHKPTDTIDKINFEKIEKISRLIFYTAWELANRDERIKLDANADK